MREITEAEILDIHSHTWVDSDMVVVSVGTLRKLEQNHYTQRDLEKSWQDGWDEGYQDRVDEEE